MTTPAPSRATRAWILPGPADAPRLFSLTPVERLSRGLAAAGVEPTQVWDGGVPPTAVGRSLVLSARFAFDPRLLAALPEAPLGWVMAPGADGKAEPAAAVVEPADLQRALTLLGATPSPALAAGDLPARSPAELAPSHDAKLRRGDAPYLLPIQPETAAALERRIYDASYKGVTDLVTRWIWPLPALATTRVLAARGVSPNAVTLLSWGLVALTTWLFAEAQFAAGLIAAWLMTFLDTVDGKLARVTLRSTRLGHVLDHGLDLLHPPVWWAAWAAGLALAGSPAAPWVTGVVVGGYLVGRLLEGAFMLRFGFETHSWRPIDSRFRSVTARRNPNLLILSAACLAARPDLGFLAVALWTLASLGFHGMRLLQAMGQARRGEAVRVWYAGPGLEGGV